MLTIELLLGDSLNSSLVAVVAVEPDVMKDWATSVGIEVVDSARFIIMLLFLFIRSETCLVETFLF